MQLFYSLEPGAYPPERAHDKDAGVDICAMYTQRIPPRGDAIFYTGVRIQLPPDTCGLLVSKSGLNIRDGITSTGLIDEGFSGVIKVKLYNHSTKPVMIMAGQKITQLVVLPVVRPELVCSDTIVAGERGENGFGSPGKYGKQIQIQVSGSQGQNN